MNFSDLAFALRLGGLAREENFVSTKQISRKVAKAQRFAKNDSHLNHHPNHKSGLMSLLKKPSTQKHQAAIG
jgi:hypothetical protein